MEVILSSRNPSKIVQINAIFAGTPIQVLSLDDVGIEGEATEDGATIEENSYKKARFAWEQGGGRWAMGEDTGLFIDVLGGEPGRFAARWAGEHASDQEIIAHTLRKLEGVEPERRTATFRAHVSVIAPDGTLATFLGEVGGTFLTEARAVAQPKMPYSSILMPNGYDRVFAEMTTEELNAVSHRGHAFKKVQDFLLSMVR